MNSRALTTTERKYRVPYRGGITLRKADALQLQIDDMPESGLDTELEVVAQQIGELQETLYADASRSLLLVFQGVDAAGKDSTIHRVFTRADPVACRVSAFKVPDGEEVQHDFLWRYTRQLPRFGEIGIFNRSYYEAVLTERVHPAVLSKPGLKGSKSADSLWQSRFHSIREYERHLAGNGTMILKFWLHVSKSQQAERLLKRIEKPNKQWKFSTMDVYDRDHWDKYMSAYVAAVSATSRSWAPWYVIPADHKPGMQLAISRITLLALQRMRLSYPKLDAQAQKQMAVMRKKLLESKPKR